MQLDTPTQFEGYAVLGRGYGYPNCCVAWWIAGMDHRVPYSPEPLKCWNHIRFVPCPKCRKMAFPELIEVIKGRRVVPDRPGEDGFSTEDIASHFTLSEWADVFESASRAMATVSQYIPK